MVEGLSVQRVEDAVGGGHDRRGPRSIIEEAQLAEDFPGHVLFEEGRLGVAGEDLRAVQSALVVDVQLVAVIALLDHVVSGGELAFLHGVDDHVQVFLLEVLEHEDLEQQVSEHFLLVFILGDHSGHEGLLRVINSVDFGRHGLPGSIHFLNLLGEIGDFVFVVEVVLVLGIGSFDAFGSNGLDGRMAYLSRFFRS